MTDQRVRPWQRAIRWVYTKQGTIVLGVPVLLLGVVAVYEFWRAGGAIFIVTGVIILALVIREWVRLYQHRADPDWPPKPKWVARSEPQSGTT
jgi:4-hydroxybenzoate polyprenyltransferase